MYSDIRVHWLVIGKIRVSYMKLSIFDYLDGTPTKINQKISVDETTHAAKNTNSKIKRNKKIRF